MEDLRIAALDAAIAAGPDDLLERAEEIYQWLRYGRDGATGARRAVAGKTVSAEVRERMSRDPAPKADVVGRDGKFTSKFEDYLRDRSHDSTD